MTVSLLHNNYMNGMNNLNYNRCRCKLFIFNRLTKNSLRAKNYNSHKHTDVTHERLLQSCRTFRSTSSCSCSLHTLDYFRGSRCLDFCGESLVSAPLRFCGDQPSPSEPTSPRALPRISLGPLWVSVERCLFPLQLVKGRPWSPWHSPLDSLWWSETLYTAIKVRLV